MTSNLRKHNYTGLVASSRAVLSLQPSCIQPDQDPFPTLSDEMTTVRKELENLRWTVCSDMDCVKAHQRGRMRSPRYKHLLRGCRTEIEGWENQTVAVPGRSATASVPKLLKDVPRLEKDQLRGNGDVHLPDILLVSTSHTTGTPKGFEGDGLPEEHTGEPTGEH